MLFMPIDGSTPQVTSKRECSSTSVGFCPWHMDTRDSTRGSTGFQTLAASTGPSRCRKSRSSVAAAGRAPVPPAMATIERRQVQQISSPPSSWEKMISITRNNAWIGGGIAGICDVPNSGGIGCVTQRQRHTHKVTKRPGYSVNNPQKSQNLRLRHLAPHVC